MKILAALLTASILGAGFAHADELMTKAQETFKPLPSTIPAVKDNQITPAKIDLGKKLFFDTRISASGVFSCNSCHNLATGGDDNLETSIGHGWQKGPRNAPTALNAVLNEAQFWDGRAPSVEEQAKGPVLNPVEMGMPSADFVVEVLKSIPGYVDAFKAAFPGEADPVNYNNFGKAVGAFERKLLTPSRWDDFLKGKKDALTADEQKGWETFAKAGCATCHNGPAVGGTMYQKLGLVKAWPELKDAGRMEATKQESDKHFFKVPSLRNVTETAPYLHDGSVKTLEDMVAKMAEHQLGKTLSNEEVSSIVTFLKALKGDIPKDFIAQPKLPESGPNTPKA